MSKNKTVNLSVPILARVEGEGALDLEIHNQEIQRLQLNIYEPPRLFEQFLEGRSYTEVLDMVARICGICPVAYQMSAAHAIEHCFGVKSGSWVRTMRRLFYCGEWLESHSLHIHFLAAPDFLGFNSAMDMAKKYPEEVKRGIRLQSLGNAIIRMLGGRSVHPVGACIGGFYKAPGLDAVESLLKQAKACLGDCESLIQWLGSLALPDNSHDFTSIALQHPHEYAMNEGQIVSDKGLAIPVDDFDLYFKEFQVPYSTALHSLLQGESYLVWPLARLNLNYEQLPNPVKAILKETGFHFPSKNMFHSVIARAAEVYYCVLEACHILERYSYPSSSFVDVQPAKGVGFGCTEAPRGLLWHRYELDEEGRVKSARIVPPTSQNQARIEEDLKMSLHQYGLDKTPDELRSYSEMIIRNYDPCISCSTHFLKLKVDYL